VFAVTDSRPVWPGSVSDRFRELSRSAGLPGTRLHDPMHGAASLALAAGVDRKTIGTNLGHVGISITPTATATCSRPPPERP